MLAYSAHLLADVGMMAAFGTLLFRTTIARRPCAWLLLATMAAAVVGQLGWLIAAAAEFGATPWQVLRDTLFGQTLGLRTALLLASVALRGRAGAILAGLAVAAGAAHGHGMAMGDAPDLVLSHALHLLAAGAWLGGLPALLLAVRAGDDAAPRRFGQMASWAVVVLVASAAWQGWILGGGLPGLIGTAYGGAIAIKVFCLAALLPLAMLNRWILAPRLPGTRRGLRRAIIAELVLGFAAVGVAVHLGALSPGMHDQPWWPFEWRLDGFAFADPDLRREVIIGLAWSASAIVLLVAGLRWRLLWLGVPLGLWLGVPHLDLLLVPAYPTSFWAEPEAPSPTSIARGTALYPRHCALCHGPAGAGDGALAQALPIPPADLTAEHLWEHSDGELYWWLAMGMRAADGTVVMPGFANQLSEAEIWSLIDAIRARNPFPHTPSGHHHH